MKNYKRMKRFGAVATAVAMLGTLSMGVFADEPDAAEEITESVIAEEVTQPIIAEEITDETELPELVQNVIAAPVITEDDTAVLGTVVPDSGDIKDSDDLLTSTQLSIISVNATKSRVEGETDKYNYLVTLGYKFKGVADVTGKQVAMVGYTYDNAAEEPAVAAAAALDAAKVYALDQNAAGSINADPNTPDGTFKIKLSGKGSDETTAPDYNPKRVNDNSTLILKIGSDAVVDGGAQAVAIDLSAAKLLKEFEAKSATATGNPKITVGDSQADAIAAIENAGITATVIGENPSDTAEGFDIEGWTLKEGETFSSNIVGGENVFVGKVVRDEDRAEITWTGDLTVEIAVEVKPLNAGNITVKYKSFKEGDTAPTAPAECIESITIAGIGAKSHIVDTFGIGGASAVVLDWVDGKALDTSKAGNTARIKVTIPPNSTSAEGSFELAAEFTTEDELTVASSGKRGDANGDDKINGLDAIAIQRYVKFGTEPNRLDLSDVNGDGRVNGLDAIALQRFVKFGTPF